jgi:Protein of unknown function (DUF732)
MRAVAGAAMLLAGAIASLIHAPSAVASPDSDFCRDLAGVGYPGDCATLVGLAKEVCAQLDRGLDLDTIIDSVDLATKDEGLSNYVIAGAPLYFCPQHDDKTGEGVAVAVRHTSVKAECWVEPRQAGVRVT